MSVIEAPSSVPFSRRATRRDVKESFDLFLTIDCSALSKPWFVNGLANTLTFIVRESGLFESADHIMIPPAVVWFRLTDHRIWH